MEKMFRGIKTIIKIKVIQEQIKRAEENAEGFMRINHLENKIAKILKQEGVME